MLNRFAVLISVLAFTLSSMCPANLLTAQIILDFKSNITQDHFNYCLEKEQGITELTDPLTIGEEYYNLGKKSLPHGENLALAYNSKAKDIFQDIKHDSLYHKVLGSMSLAYINLGNFEIAEEYNTQCLNYWTSLKNNRWTIVVLTKKAYLERAQGNYVKALEALNKAYKINKQDKDLPISGDLINRLGIVYIDIGDYQSAHKLLTDYLEAKDSDTLWHTSIMTQLAQCYEEMGNDQLARKYHNIVNKTWIQSHSYKTRIHGYSSVASLAIEDKDYRKAELYLDSAYTNAKLYDNPTMLSYVENQLSSYYLDRGDLVSLESILPSFLHNATKGNRSKNLMLAYKAHSDFYTQKKNFEKALHYRNLYDSLYYTLYSEQVINQIKHLDIKYDQEKNQETIAMLEEQNSLKEKNLAFERKTKMYLALILVAVALGLVLIYLLYKQKLQVSKALRSKNEIIEKSLQTNKILIKEIHHRVKNNLMVISSLLSLQSRYVDEEHGKSAIQTAQSRVQAMALLHQKLYKREKLNSINIAEYFTDLFQDIEDTYLSPNSNISIEFEVEEILMDIEMVVPMGLILNELVTNSIKHAFKDVSSGSINIHIIKDEGNIVIDYADNGCGLPFDEIPKKSNSLGMEIIKSFADKLEAEITIDNSKGCHIIFVFKDSSF